ncbi:MAG: ATP-binding protein [Oscillospiraceae bacterium]|nr:ATP-binding protein [Oscillospiraceae bacterium]
MDCEELYIKLSGIAVFRGILELDVTKKLMSMLKYRTVESCGDFAAALYKHGTSLTKYISEVVCADENICLLAAAAGREIPLLIKESVERELRIFEDVSRITPADIQNTMDCGKNISADYLPCWETENVNLSELYVRRLANVMLTGYGIYENHTGFMLKDGKIVPVLTPDPQRLSDLSEYAAERKKIFDNTMALINGKPAANALLYGDAGTGKSSTVKAVVNELSGMGLRLIEIKKAQLHLLPDVMSEISTNPLKFVIFIDDLSFAGDDDDFGALKAVLEGSAASKAPNSVIYATSNRFHLVKESFDDRHGNDVHASDTREELLSLSERFGLKVTFAKPDKNTYLSIVKSLAESYDIDIPEEELFIKAESFALRRSGRSGRAAKQFVESLLCR